MSDLISRSALIEELKRYEEELKNDREIAIETDDEQMLFAIMNQETAICRIRRNVLHLPTAYDVENVEEQIENLSSADADYTLAEDLVDRKSVLAIVRCNKETNE